MSPSAPTVSCPRLPHLQYFKLEHGSWVAGRHLLCVRADHGVGQHAAAASGDAGRASGEAHQLGIRRL